MKLIINNASDIPIYEQIKNAIINGIMSGDLEENESLPSIRILAQDIRISIMTIKKAYDELEREGYIITRQGKGSFVAPKNLELAKEFAKKEIEKHIYEIINISKKYGINTNEVIELLKYLEGDNE